MKIFITNAPDWEPQSFYSKDFYLSKKAYKYALSYMLESRTELGETAKVIICHPGNKKSEMYLRFRQELEAVATEKQLKLELTDVFFNSMVGGEFRENSLMDGFKEVVRHILPKDQLYTDLCYGSTLFTNVLNTVTFYALKTTVGVSCMTIYGGARYIVKGRSVMELVSVENLQLLNKVAADMSEGTRDMLDKLISFEMPTEDYPTDDDSLDEDKDKFEDQD